MIVESSETLILSSDSVKIFLHSLSCGLKTVEDGNVHDIETLWDKLDEGSETLKKCNYGD